MLKAKADHDKALARCKQPDCGNPAKYPGGGTGSAPSPSPLPPPPPPECPPSTFACPSPVDPKSPVGCCYEGTFCCDCGPCCIYVDCRCCG
jgi:hypothetical protein